jgi:elongation factor 1-gamma
VYLCRGQSWEDVFNVGPDYESYEFKQLDFSKPEDKTVVGQNWAWEDEVDGMKAADGKVFK